MRKTDHTAYTKLTRRNRTLSGYTQLWVTSDHILQVNSTRIAEEYKRFAFSDIQSIMVAERPPVIVLQGILIAAAFACGALWFRTDSVFARWTLAASGALALLILAVDLARGPRCRCYLHTRVSSERLTSVSRMRIARRFLSTVRPSIEAVQGVLTAEPQMEVEPAASEPPPPALTSSPGYLPEILFATFLLNALLIWAAAQFPKATEIPGVLLTTLFGEMLLILVSMLRRPGRDARILVYIVIAISIAGAGFDLTTIVRETFGWYMTLLTKAKNGDKSIPSLSIFPPGSRQAIIAYSWRAVAGVCGIAAAFYERRKSAQ